MLVLSRKPSERITIGESIQITVVSIEGGRVRLGIEAPAVIPVVRSELLDRAQPAVGAVAHVSSGTPAEAVTEGDR